MTAPFKIDERTASFAAHWWAVWMVHGPVEENAAAFEAELKRRLLAGEVEDSDNYRNRIQMYCDYDPAGTLLEAIHAVGLKCRGFLFSAGEVGFPTKTGMRIYPDGSVETKEGYGAAYIQVLAPREETPT